MSLVAYDKSSDESEDSSLEEENKPIKKQKESVKITIPSLKEFEDEDDEKPVAKKSKLQSGSGLFSLLPPPKNTPSSEKSGFMPHILLSKKKEKSEISSAQSKNSTTTTTLKVNTSSTSPLTASEEQESDDENISVKDNPNSTGGCDFFWLDDLASKNEAATEDPISASVKGSTFLQNLSSSLPSSSASNVHQTYLSESKDDALLQHQLSVQNVSQVEGNNDYMSSEHQWQSADDNYVNNSTDDSKESLLKDKEFLKLQGRKRELDNIDIIDVNADDQLTNRNEWLMKSITEESTYRPKKKHGLPTQQQKRKHQITYLAFQAKEREMDLKNQWSLNRLTRRETQSKYGF